MKKQENTDQHTKQHNPVKWLWHKSMGRIEDEIRKQDKKLTKISEKIDQIYKKNDERYRLQTQQMNDLREFIQREFDRRDNWGALAREYRLKAGDKPFWIIKCPAPGDALREHWGDYPFAMSLRKNLEKIGVFAIVETREDWGCETEADVIIVLRGSKFYRPDRRNINCKYIMWNMSHPDWVTDEEYELYDAVCIASNYYAAQLKERLAVPVFPLLQCTDTDLFYPSDPGCEDNNQMQYQYVFIGNSRGIARSSVMWAVEDDLPLTIWGSGWDKILAGHLDLIRDKSIENSLIPDLYRQSKATINDHWADMLDKQFVNNRIFDALACGLPVISDTCPELKEIFPNAVLHYTDRTEFEACIREIEEKYDDVKARVLEQQSLIREEYSFEARARDLKQIVKEISNS